MLAFYALVVFRIVSGSPLDSGFTLLKGNTSCCLTDLTVPDFDVQKFGKHNGSWWGTKYYEHPEHICVNVSFKFDQNNVMTSETWSESFGNDRYEISHQLHYFSQPDPSKTGKYKVDNYPSSTDGLDIWFLGTDYATYTVIYMGCDSFFDKCSIIAAILTSEQEPDNSVYEIALQVADSYGLQQSHFTSMNMSTCGCHN